MFSTRIRAVLAVMVALLALTGCAQVTKNASSESVNVMSTVVSEPKDQSAEELISRDVSDTVSRETTETEGQNADAASDRDVSENSSQASAETSSTSPATEATEENSPTSSTPEAAPFVFNPHVYSCFLEADYSDAYREALFNLCDALQAGGDTFVCESQEIYKFCMGDVVLNQLYPVACMQITGESPDGSAPYENGVGRIFYTKSKEDFLERQKNFQKEITEILNAYVRPGDSDFEKCLALYDYIVSNYEYDYFNEVDASKDGAVCSFMKYKKGVCTEFSALYSYLLLQCGVNAIQVDKAGEHAWSFVDINGKGYHIDPTFGMKDDLSSQPFLLEYFMMTDDDRAASGYKPEEMSVFILPSFYAKDSAYNFVANDDSYRLPEYAYCSRYDRDRNVLYYYNYAVDDEHLFAYE